MPPAISQLLASAVRGCPLAQAAAVAGGGVVHLAKQLEFSHHGLCSGGDERLLQCCAALEALVDSCPAAQVHGPTLGLRVCVYTAH